MADFSRVNFLGWLQGDDATSQSRVGFFSWDQIAQPGGGDVTAPTLVGAITVGTKTDTTISISWPAGSDNVAVTSYEVSTNGGTDWTDTESTSTSRTFTSLTALTSYDIAVRAKDAAGLVSTPPLETTTSTYRAGATGQDIFDLTGPIGDGDAGILYNDVVLPEDANKWFSYRIITPLASPEFLDIDPQGRFTWTGTVDDSFTYQLEVDGVDSGSPQLVQFTAEGEPGEPGESVVSKMGIYMGLQL